MIDVFLGLWTFLWAYVVPVALVAGGIGTAGFCFFVAAYGSCDEKWRRIESLGFGLVVAAMTKWFVQLYFEFRSYGHDPSETGVPFPMIDTLLAMIVITVGIGAVNLLKAAGLPYIVIGVFCALAAVFGF